MATPRLHIGDKNYSSWSMRPWLALKHGGIAFEEVLHALPEGDGRRQAGLRRDLAERTGAGA